MKKTFVLIAIIILGFPAIFGLSRFLEATQAPLPTEIAEADLAFRADTLKKYSLGFDGLIADFYWIGSLQYVGRKINESAGLQAVQIDDLKPLNPKLLYPMLDAATTLDPDLTVAYSYGATVLPAINIDEAVKIAQKAISTQPDNWKFYHQLGYIYWKNEEYQKAAQIYEKGATKQNAPPWMHQISAILQARGSSRETAREIYRQLYENAQDEQTKDLAVRRLWQVESFDELDALRTVLQDFQAKNNRCVDDWREAFTFLRTTKLANGKGLRFSQSLEPLDPSNAVYYLLNQNGDCSVRIDFKTSKVPSDLPAR